MLDKTISNDKELVEFIADRLPIATDVTERFQGAVKGYLFGDIELAMALSSRDKLIEQLLAENRELFKRIKTHDTSDFNRDILSLVGRKVKVVDINYAYTTYQDMFDKLNQDFDLNLTFENRAPDDDVVYKIVGYSLHEFSCDLVVLITDCFSNEGFLIGISGLEYVD